MKMITTIKSYLQRKISTLPEKPAAEAYDAWSATYDCQPGNLVLALDEKLFALLARDINLENKTVADIGCGTGRHWQKIYASKPKLVIGFDVSEGMLNRLKCKFPAAMIQHITDNHLKMVPSALIDCVITTLTIAHIKNIEEAIAAWSRITKKDGDLLITDFHPAILATGGQRSFSHQGKSMAVINYVHQLEKVKNIFSKHGFVVIKQEERYINETLRHYYESQNALDVYERFKGLPVIYGLHLKKLHGAE